MSGETPLGAELRRLIAAEGPISVGHFMALCLNHPRHGYYMTRDPFGPRGDFVTAPEISQMFGELLGLWATVVWQRMGAPDPVLLVELGPGRGTLLADALRAARLVPGFLAAVRVHLVEASPILRERQKAALGASGAGAEWHAALTDVPAGPAIVLANEFFDALPVFQYVKAADGWRERMVGLDEAGRLAFALHPVPAPYFAEAMPAALPATPQGAVYEMRPPAESDALCHRIGADGGAALIVDYGHSVSAFGDTLQAVRSHGFVDPLETPGEADLTAHVDFSALVTAAERAGVSPLGPMTQGEFLRNLGIEARAERLKSTATAAQRDAIDAALTRLIGAGRGEMGELFKVLVLADRSLGLKQPFG